MKRKNLFVVTLTVGSLAISSAFANQPTTTPTGDMVPYSDRDQMKAWGTDKDALQRALGTGKPRDFYRTELEKMGYHITAVNRDKPDYLEYEVVKGKKSFEVQVDFDEKTKTAKKVDVTTNAWKADATERALKDAGYKYEYPKTTTENPERYSDRDRAKTFKSEKDRMEKAMRLGEGKDFYKQELQKMGFTITSVNKDKADYAEYEIVKGRDTYEVQIDFDKAGKAKKVDFTANAWKSDATERALKTSTAAAPTTTVPVPAK